MQIEWPEVDLGSDIEGKCLGLVGDDGLVVVLRQLKHLQQGIKETEIKIWMSESDSDGGCGVTLKNPENLQKLCKNYLWVNCTFPRADHQQQHQW